MITPKTTLKNPYYFFNENVLYEIKDYNDDDNCGVHKVFFVTEEKEVKAGDTYYDVNGNKVVATEDGTVAASTGAIDEEKSLGIFPGFYVQYDVVSEELYGQKKYYWLQDMIADGDTIDGEGKFLINQNHGNDTNKRIVPGASVTDNGDIGPVSHDFIDGGSLDAAGGSENEGNAEITYMSKFIDSVNKDLTFYTERGYSVNEIKQKMPYYVFEHEESEEILINGKKATNVQVSSEFFTPVSDEKLLEGAYDVINLQAMDFADSKLKKFGKKVIRENVVWVDKDKVEDIDA